MNPHYCHTSQQPKFLLPLANWVEWHICRAAAQTDPAHENKQRKLQAGLPLKEPLARKQHQLPTQV